MNFWNIAKIRRIYYTIYKKIPIYWRFKKHRKNSKKKRTVLKLCFQFIRQTWKLKNQLKKTYYFHKMKKAYCAIKNCVFRKVFLKFDQAFKDKIQCALRNHYCFCWIILLQLQLFVCSSPPARASKRPLLLHRVAKFNDPRALQGATVYTSMQCSSMMLAF